MLETRQGGRNEVSSKVFANWSRILANRASAMESVMYRKWAGPTSPTLKTTARESCWVSNTNCANCHGNMKAREERERRNTWILPGLGHLEKNPAKHKIIQSSLPYKEHTKNSIQCRSLRGNSLLVMHVHVHASWSHPTAPPMVYEAILLFHPTHSPQNNGINQHL